MKANKNATSKKSGKGGWWVGGALMVAAALAITFAVRSAPAKPAAEPPSLAQGVSNAAANQRALDNLRALGANIPVPGHGETANSQILQDAANQRALDNLRALGVNIPLQAQGEASRAQAVPNAANQHALDYLRALGANIP